MQRYDLGLEITRLPSGVTAGGLVVKDGVAMVWNLFRDYQLVIMKNV